jgi:hypothetical protein
VVMRNFGIPFDGVHRRHGDIFVGAHARARDLRGDLISDAFDALNGLRHSFYGHFLSVVGDPCQG